MGATWTLWLEKYPITKAQWHVNHWGGLWFELTKHEIGVNRTIVYNNKELSDYCRLTIEQIL